MHSSAMHQSTYIEVLMDTFWRRDVLPAVCTSVISERQTKCGHF